MTGQLTHWKKLTNPDYFGAYEFQPKEEKTLTIKAISSEMVIGTDGKKEMCTICRFQEQSKPMILNKTNCKEIEKAYKSAYVQNWIGKKITLHVEKVKAFGEIIEAVRISAIPPKIVLAKDNESIICSVCENQILSFGDMTAVEIANYTLSKYGCAMCSDCAKKKAEEQKKAHPDAFENNETEVENNNENDKN